MPRALVIRHEASDGIAGFAPVIEAAGYRIDTIDAPDTDFRTVDLTTPDIVVVMGGSMGVYETDDHPWIGAEVAALAGRLERSGPTLGVCLGAQMIAAALGARVYPGPVKELGFAPISVDAIGMASPVRHLAGVPVLHWHGDTFDLPAGVERLASTDAYANQAFRRGKQLLAVQCHPEIGDSPGFDEWLEDEAYIREGGTDPAALRAAYDLNGARAAAAGRAMVADWLAALD